MRVLIVLGTIILIGLAAVPSVILPARAVCDPPEPPQPDFLMEAEPDSFEMIVGSANTFTSTITVTSIDGFAEIIALTLPDPSPLSASLSAPSVDLRLVPSESVTLTIVVDSTVLPDFYFVTVDGSGGSPVISNSVDVSVDVLGPDFSLEANPSSLTLAPGEFKTSTLTVASENGFVGTISLSAEIFPESDLVASLDYYSVPLTSGRSQDVVLTVTSTQSTPADSYTVSITGTFGSPEDPDYLEQSESVFVKVTGPEFSMFPDKFFLEILPGSSDSSKITLLSHFGFSGNVDVDFVVDPPPPAGFTVEVDPMTVPLAPDGSADSTLTVTVDASVRGQFFLDIEITGTGGTPPSTSSTDVLVLVPEIDISASPDSLAIDPGSTDSSTITVKSLVNFEGMVTLTATTFDPCLEVVLSPSRTVDLLPGEAEPRTLSINVDDITPPGIYVVSVRGQIEAEPQYPVFDSALVLVNVGGVDTTDPAWPPESSLTWSDVGQTSVTLSWTPATDNVGVNSYEILQDGITVEFVSGTTTSHTVMDLLPGTEYDFQIVAYDAEGNSAFGPFATITTASPANNAPIANNDSYSTAENAPLSVAAPGVLANDSDPDDDQLNAQVVAGPASGILTLNADGSFTYTPAPDFTGTDSFTYIANDGSLDSNIATVSITVSPNPPPVAADDSYTVEEDNVLNIAATGVLGNDNDPNGDPITAVLSSSTSSGSLALNPNGSFMYTPNANFCGNDGFTYRANDGTSPSNTATVSITVTCVNDAPVAVDDSYTTAEDTPLSVLPPGVLASDRDVDGDALTAVLHTGPSSGTLVLNSDGSFTYTPNTGFLGTDTFTYGAHDSFTFTEGTVTISVTQVNDAPVATDDGYSTDEDSVLTIASPGVLNNDSDLDGDGLSAVLVGGPTSGTLTLNADGSFTYAPLVNFNGQTSFTYRASDGILSSEIATVTITVTAVNDDPVANDDSYSTLQGQTLTVPVPGVLGNDIDADGNALTAIVVSTTTNGALTLNNDGSFTYTPAANFNDQVTFTYQVNDGFSNSNTATVTITVTAVPVNRAPVLSPIGNKPVNEGTPLSFTLTATDPDGQPITFSASGVPQGATFNPSTRQFSWTPTEAQGPGTFSVTFTATDNGTPSLSDSETITITVSEVNQAPVLPALASRTATQGSQLTFNIAATDPDTPSTLTYSLEAGAPSGASITPSGGVFSWTPTADQAPGEYTITVRVSDGTTSDTESFTVTLSRPLQAPTAPRPFWEEYWYIILIVVVFLVGIPVAMKVRAKPESKSQV